MNRLVLVFLFTFNFGFVKLKSEAQVINQVDKYHQKINFAELSIVDGNYKKSIMYYKQAFKIHNRPFAIDIYNAALCSSLVGNSKLACNYLKILTKMGLLLSDFKKDTTLMKIEKSIDWKYLMLEYPILHKSSIEKIEKNLLDSLNFIAYQDQYFRKKTRDYSKIYGDSVKIIDIKNDEILRKLINKYNYPTEHQIGVTDSTLKWHDFFLIIWHQTQLNLIFDYTNILMRIKG